MSNSHESNQEAAWMPSLTPDQDSYEFERMHKALKQNPYGKIDPQTPEQLVIDEEEVQKFRDVIKRWDESNENLVGPAGLSHRRK